MFMFKEGPNELNDQIFKVLSRSKCGYNFDYIILNTPNARLTPNSWGTCDWLTTKKWPNSGVGRQDRMFLPCYSLEGHKLFLNTHNSSGLLAIEINKLHERF